ncbi:MAG TPA: hypothetical protein VN625_11675 [Desulfuromonadaceae bacterium]|nr:hypothetical protein [Desulfuromonadaceae bacterium]
MNAMEPPIYRSRRRAASLWQEYRIFPNRIELQAIALLRTLIIPANEIVSIEVRPPVFRNLKRGVTWGTKLDLADLYEHVLIRRKKGIFKTIAFTPDNPTQFVQITKSICPDLIA